MGRLFFYALPLLFSAILFFPIYVETDAHYDMNRRKFAFAVYAYKFLPVLGGYVATYQGGLALHISKKKAILLPYSKMNSERKKFSIVKTFRLKRFSLTTETGAEYLPLTAVVHTVLRTYFFIKGEKKEGIENNLWLTDGDVLRISFHILVYFNLFILFKNFIKFCKEKIRILWQKKNQKINALIDSSLEKLDSLADVNTIIGKPITTASGYQLIPFSKVTLGNLSGGGEYGDVKVVKETDSFPFAGGSGAVISMKPMGFVIDDGKSCRILRISEEPVDNLIERAGEIVHDIMTKE